MKCQNCGAALKGDYCEYCGTKAEANPSFKPYGTYNYNYNYTYTQDTKRPFAAKTGDYTDYKNAPPGQNNYSGNYHYGQPFQSAYKPRYEQRGPEPVNERPREAVSEKSLLIALILCAIFGALGVHRFYAGKAGTGILYLFTGGLFGIGYVIDIILIALGRFRDGEGRRISWSSIQDF